MKLSIVIAVYNSHGAVERQMKHFAKMNLPDDIEIILVDDGSSPPLSGYDLKNLKIHYTNDKRAWTQGIARNAGVKIATGDYVLCTDIDHILSKEAIMDSYNFNGDRMLFPRYFGVLLEDGTLSQEPKDLEMFGLDMSRLNTKRGLYASVHGNTYTMKRSTFWLLGGNDERHCTLGRHAGSREGEDSVMNRRWNHYALKNGITIVVGPKIYMFPVARYHIDGNTNPLGLFNDLSQEQVQQPNKP